MPPNQPPARPSKPYRDATGARLADYPQPSVAVDTAVLTLAPRTNPARGAPPHRLSVLLIRRPEGVGVTGGHPAQLAVFDDPDRDERGWVLSVAHLAVISYAALAGVLLAAPERVRLVPVSGLEPLPYDHKAIVAAAVHELRARYADRPDPERLLGPHFTIRLASRQSRRDVLGNP